MQSKSFSLNVPVSCIWVQISRPFYPCWTSRFVWVSTGPQCGFFLFVVCCPMVLSLAFSLRARQVIACCCYVARTSFVFLLFFQRVRSEHENPTNPSKNLTTYKNFNVSLVVCGAKERGEGQSPLHFKSLPSRDFFLMQHACRVSFIFFVYPRFRVLTACCTLDVFVCAGGTLHRRRGTTRPAALAPQGERGPGCDHHLRHPHLRRA